MEFAVVIHEAEEGGCRTEVPSIPVRATQGESFEELLDNVYEAVEGRLSAEMPVAIFRRGKMPAFEAKTTTGCPVIFFGRLPCRIFLYREGESSNSKSPLQTSFMISGSAFCLGDIFSSLFVAFMPCSISFTDIILALG